MPRRAPICPPLGPTPWSSMFAPLGAWGMTAVMLATAYAAPASASFTPHPIRPMIVRSKRPWPPSCRRARLYRNHDGRGEEHTEQEKDNNTESERRKDENKELE
jgi:hypothetical protein